VSPVARARSGCGSSWMADRISQTAPLSQSRQNQRFSPRLEPPDSECPETLASRKSHRTAPLAELERSVAGSRPIRPSRRPRQEKAPTRRSRGASSRLADLSSGHRQPTPHNDHRDARTSRLGVLEPGECEQSGQLLGPPARRARRRRRAEFQLGRRQRRVPQMQQQPVPGCPWSEPGSTGGVA
jgi:hypothetical protein